MQEYKRSVSRESCTEEGQSLIYESILLDQTDLSCCPEGHSGKIRKDNQRSCALREAPHCLDPKERTPDEKN